VTTPVPLRTIDRGQATVLVADGEETIRLALRRYLTDERFEVRTAATGRETLAAAAGNRVGCVVLDAAIADPPAPEVVARLLAQDPVVAVVLVAGDPETAVADAAMERGASDRLSKPVDLADLCRAVQRGLRRRDALLESERINTWLQEEVAHRTTELHRERENLQRLSVAVLETLVNALEARDPLLGGHSTRVAELAARVGAESGLDTHRVELVRIAGRLHDIGKIGIPDAILSKEGPLSREEFELVKAHPVIGAQILAPLPHLEEALQYVRGHHERWDGSGYPDGLAGDAIAIGARIIGAAEIFDALTTPRPYQELMSHGQAVARMRDLVGSVLDPAVYEALAKVVEGR
jgi:putative two-component system response regulator